MDIKQYKSRYSIVDDKKKLEYTSASAARLSRPDFLEVIEDYLDISRKRQHNPLSLSKLQLNLLLDIITDEYALKQYRRKLQELIEASPSEDESEEEKKAIIENIEGEIDFHETSTKVYREIADGIAWRTLGFNRALLYYLVSRPSPGPISLEGIESELLEWSRIYDSREGISILNDITSFLRVGDVTNLKNDGTLEFVEIKTKRPRGGARFSRQKERLQQTVELFSCGKATFKEESLAIDEFDIKPDNYLNNVLNLINDAMRVGVAITSIGEHLLVYCLDLRTGSMEKAKTILDPVIDRTMERWDGDIIIPLRSLEKFKYGRTYAPYSIFPFPNDICVSLMAGALLLTTFLNLSKVMEYFEGRGWAISESPEEHLKQSTDILETHTMTVKKGPLYVKVPPMDIGRLAFEFLRPRVLVQLFEEYYAIGRREGSYSIVNFQGEKDIWV